MSDDREDREAARQSRHEELWKGVSTRGYDAALVERLTARVEEMEAEVARLQAPVPAVHIGPSIEAERAACAELVRAAGCSCLSFSSRGWAPEWGDGGIKEHHPACPQALAAAIEARGRA